MQSRLWHILSCCSLGGGLYVGEYHSPSAWICKALLALLTSANQQQNQASTRDVILNSTPCIFNSQSRLSDWMSLPCRVADKTVLLQLQEGQKAISRWSNGWLYSPLTLVSACLFFLHWEDVTRLSYFASRRFNQKDNKFLLCRTHCIHSLWAQIIPVPSLKLILLLYRGQADDLMEEIPTVIVDKLPDSVSRVIPRPVTLTKVVCNPNLRSACCPHSLLLMSGTKSGTRCRAIRSSTGHLLSINGWKSIWTAYLRNMFWWPSLTMSSSSLLPSGRHLPGTTSKQTAMHKSGCTEMA